MTSPFLSATKTCTFRLLTWGSMTLPCLGSGAHAQDKMVYYGQNPRFLIEHQALGMANDARRDAQAGKCYTAETSLRDLKQEATEATKFADTPESIVRAQMTSDLYFKTLFDTSQSCPFMPIPRPNSFAEQLSQRGHVAVDLARSGKCEDARKAADEILNDTTAKGIEYNAKAISYLQQGKGQLPDFRETSIYTLGHVVGPAVAGICYGNKDNPDKWLDTMVDMINQQGGLKALAPAINQRLQSQGRSL